MLGFNLTFLNTFDAGESYTEKEYREWLGEAGFIDISRDRSLQSNGKVGKFRCDLKWLQVLRELVILVPACSSERVEWCYGRPPYRLLIDNDPVAKERMLVAGFNNN